jgi:hypothetical protein
MKAANVKPIYIASQHLKQKLMIVSKFQLLKKALLKSQRLLISIESKN